MADSETKAEKQAPAKSDEGAMTFPVADLIARAPEYLKVPVHIAAGGLDGQKKDMTLAGAQAAIKSWLEKPVTGA